MRSLAFSEDEEAIILEGARSFEGLKDDRLKS